MGVLGDTFLALLKVISFLAITGWIVFFVVWQIKKKWGRIKFWWKYSFRWGSKQQFDDDVVEWCEANIKKDPWKLEREVLVRSEGLERKDVEELMLIFRKVKEMKGGEYDGTNKSKLTKKVFRTLQN